MDGLQAGAVRIPTTLETFLSEPLAFLKRSAYLKFLKMKRRQQRINNTNDDKSLI